MSLADSDDAQYLLPSPEAEGGEGYRVSHLVADAFPADRLPPLSGPDNKSVAWAETIRMAAKANLYPMAGDFVKGTRGAGQRQAATAGLGIIAGLFRQTDAKYWIESYNRGVSFNRAWLAGEIKAALGLDADPSAPPPEGRDLPDK